MNGVQITALIFAIYFVLCFLTAMLLAQTPYSENGFLVNMLYAPLYWLSIFMGRL
jgi:hypothetical protein